MNECTQSKWPRQRGQKKKHTTKPVWNPKIKVYTCSRTGRGREIEEERQDKGKKEKKKHIKEHHKQLKVGGGEMLNYKLLECQGAKKSKEI